MTTHILALAAAALAVATPALSANLIVNGGFEDPAIPAGTFAALGGGGSIPGWDILGVDTALVNSSYAEANITFQARSGQAFMDLSGVGNSGPTSGIAQDVATLVGQIYTLSFWVGNADGSGNANYLLPSTVNLSIDGGGLVSFTNGATTTGLNNWRRFSATFTATGTTTNIAFLNGTDLGDSQTGLDDVSLVEGTTAVPEPSAWMLMISGFAILGGMARQKRRGGVAG